MSDYNDLKKLEELRREGILTDEEFQDAKKRVLATPDSPVDWSSDPAMTHPSSRHDEVVPPLAGGRAAPRTDPDLDPLPTLPSLHGVKNFFGLPKKTFLAGLHLSQLLHLVWTPLGLMVPVVGWLLFKNRDADVDRHGRVLLNWLIPLIIAKFVFLFLKLFLIGYPLVWAINVVTMIIGGYAALKAYLGGTPKYPFSLLILKVKPPPALPDDLISRILP